MSFSAMGHRIAPAARGRQPLRRSAAWDTRCDKAVALPAVAFGGATRPLGYMMRNCKELEKIKAGGTSMPYTPCFASAMPS